jgi:hypothetical protein
MLVKAARTDGNMQEMPKSDFVRVLRNRKVPEMQSSNGIWESIRRYNRAVKASR